MKRNYDINAFYCTHENFVRILSFDLTIRLYNSELIRNSKFDMKRDQNDKKLQYKCFLLYACKFSQDTFF